MTKMTEKLKESMEIPVIAAPMFIISNPEMVVACCREGIIGTFPLLNARTDELLEEWMEKVKHAAMDAERKGEKMAPWGVNIIVHKSNARYEQNLEMIRKYEPPIVITSLGKPVNEAGIVHGYGGLVFSDVISVEHAKKAAESGVDGLILVCSGAGGHGGTLNPFAFVAEVKAFFDGIIILAGCMSSGSDVLAAQVMGADFVYMGTKFIAVDEADATLENKQMLIDSSASDIIYTDAISGVNANFMKESIQKAGLDPDSLKRKEEVSVAGDKPKAWKHIWSAGQGVGSITGVYPVREVIGKMKEEYREAKNNLLHV